MKHRLLGVTILSGALGFACAPARPTQPSRPISVAVHGFRESVDAYNRQCLGLERLRAKTKIEYRSGKTRKAFKAAVYIDVRSGRLRLRADAYFISIFDMAFDQDHFSVFVPSQRTCYQGTGDSFRGFAMQDLSEALSPRPLRLESGEVLIEEDSRAVVLTELATADDGCRRPVQRVYLSRADLSLARRTIFYETGVVKSELNYGASRAFAAGAFPARVIVTRPWQNISVTLDIDELESPATFNAALFTLTPPAGTKTVDLKREVSEDILFETRDGSHN